MTWLMLGSEERRSLRRARVFGVMTASALLSSSIPATPAVAQLAPGYSGYSSAPERGSEAEYWFMLRQLGDCVANMKTAQAEAFLATEIDSKAEGREFKTLFGGRNNSCMRNFVSATIVRSQVRGVLAESLFKRNLRIGRPIRPIEPKASQIATIHQFAQCYVYREPAAAQRLLMGTRLKSDEETSAVQDISSGFAQCLPSRTVSLDATDVRLAFAEALYHASKANRG